MADSKASHEFAGRRGIGVLCQSISIGRIKEAWTAHNRALTEAQGREVPFGEKLAVVRPTYVAETYEQAVKDVSWGSKQLGAWYSHNPVKVYKAMVTEAELSEDDVRRRYLELVGLTGDAFEEALRKYSLEDYFFLRALSEERDPFPGFDIGLRAHRLVDAAYRSAADGAHSVTP